MILPYVDTLKGVLPDFGPYFDQHFRDQSDMGVSRGIKRFVNSLSHKKIYQAINQIDEWKRTHKDESVIQIVEAVREGLRVKISTLGIFILSKHPALVKMNRYAIKEVIGKGTRSNQLQIASQILLHPGYLGKVSKILKKLKRDNLNVAQNFCFILTKELAKEDQETALKLVADFNDNETAKKIYDHYSSVSRVLNQPSALKEGLEKAFPEFAPKEEVKKEAKKETFVPFLLISTMAVSLFGFALSYLLGAFILLAGGALAFYFERFQGV